jgi:hypothetical protein
MNEVFLQYAWQHKIYHPELVSSEGQTIEVIHPGIKNTDGGPDFFNAKIKIDGTLWAGNVEIHQNADEWYQHQHHTDAAYNNVILHVVKQSSKETLNSNNRKIPVCELKINDNIRQKYQQLYFNDQWIACEHAIKNVSSFELNQWLDRLLIERLESKSQLINELLKSTKNDWDQIFFILLSRSFGFGINGLPFEMMARQTPLNILLKHTNNLFQLEALLFGQAGFLTTPKYEDEYTLELQKEYNFLKAKYQLSSIEQHLWKFLRLRPVNFPTVRIAQLAHLIYLTKGSFDQLLLVKEKFSSFNKLIISTSDYWLSHYQLGHLSKKVSTKILGKQSQHRIIYNTIVPYLFIYTAKHKQEDQKEKIIDYLYQQPTEKNKTIDKWAEIGIVSESEANAQALIHLKNNYCDHKKCLNCHIGFQVLCKM